MRLPLAVGAIAITALVVGSVRADDAGIGVGRIDDGVPSANPASGAPSTIVDPDFTLKVIATGSDPLENPNGVITKFGFLSNGTRTEPDQNTYLVLDRNPGGPTAGFNYGRHFLFQGHENGGGQAYITRINLDVNDPAHRITLLTPGDVNGTTGFSAIDGGTFNPFTKRLLFTQETSSAGNGTGKVIQVTLDWPPTINTLENFLGLGGYEGIRNDDEGNIYLIEDVGGTRPGGLGANNVPLNAAAQPNSFVYRYLPNNPKRIEDGGVLQALQVLIDGTPVTFHAADPKGDILSDAQLELHTPGTSYPIRWVTIATPPKNNTVSLGSATVLAKAAGATPFKRPENMAWLPNSKFRTFFFTPTGDTDAPTSQVPELAARGSWGSIFRVDLRNVEGDQKKDDGSISIFFLGDQVHNSFDNINFANEHQVLAAEDRGDALHDQLNTLDSVWTFDVRSKNSTPLRFIALGRDASASGPGQEDNEPTGVHVSNGSTTKSELLGTDDALEETARGFFTQQHGDNVVYEFVRSRKKQHAQN
jgi:hypothetical protein